jgi:hypothetical protein
MGLMSELFLYWKTLAAVPGVVHRDAATSDAFDGVDVSRVAAFPAQGSFRRFKGRPPRRSKTGGPGGRPSTMDADGEREALLSHHSTQLPPRQYPRPSCSRQRWRSVGAQLSS